MGAGVCTDCQQPSGINGKSVGLGLSVFPEYLGVSFCQLFKLSLVSPQICRAILHPGAENKENHEASIMADMEDEFDTVDMTNMVGQSVAQFHYAANQDDELTIYPGDVINVYDKSDEGWWQGELKGKYGLFPASYV